MGSSERVESSNDPVFATATPRDFQPDLDRVPEGEEGSDEGGSFAISIAREQALNSTQPAPASSSDAPPHFSINGNEHFFRKLTGCVGKRELYAEDLTHWYDRLISINKPYQPESDADDKSDERLGHLNLAVLMRGYLSTVRRELIFAAKRFDEHDPQPTRMDLDSMMEAGKLLESYCSALDRYKQMKDAQLLGKEDPFLLRTNRGLDTLSMTDAGFINTLKRKTLYGPQRYHLYGNSRAKKNKREKLNTFFMALLGGVALLAPMLVMVFHKSLHLTVITVCVSVVIFSAILAVFSTRTAFEIFGTTAAYAAVLVVFVGTSS